MCPKLNAHDASLDQTCSPSHALPPQENNYCHFQNVILASFSVPTFNKSLICQDCLCNISVPLTLPHLSSLPPTTFHLHFTKPLEGVCASGLAIHSPYRCQGSPLSVHMWSLLSPHCQVPHHDYLCSLLSPEAASPLSPTHPSSSLSDHLHPAPSTPLVGGSPPSLPFSGPAPTHPSGHSFTLCPRKRLPWPDNLVALSTAV